jgi:hypothetical protein
VKKFAVCAIVFILGVEYGRMAERLRHLNEINKVKAESDKKYGDMMDRFLSEEA